MNNEQFKEFIRQLKEHIKEWQDDIENKKKSAVIESLLSNKADMDRLWQCIAEEMKKQTDESRLCGKYATDLAKQMFTAMSKEQLQALIANVLKRLENQQNTGNQECI